MDIKSGREHYKKAAGIGDLKIRNVEESAAFLMENHIPYEFRTTVVKGIHTMGDFVDIGKWLEGNSPYFLQNYVDSDQVLYSGYTSFSDSELQGFFENIETISTPGLLSEVNLSDAKQGAFSAPYFYISIPESKSPRLQWAGLLKAQN